MLPVAWAVCRFKLGFPVKTPVVCPVARKQSLQNPISLELEQLVLLNTRYCTVFDNLYSADLVSYHPLSVVCADWVQF